MPGGLSYVDVAAPNGGISTAFEVNLDLSHLLADIVDVRERIKRAFTPISSSCSPTARTRK